MIQSLQPGKRRTQSVPGLKSEEKKKDELGRLVDPGELLSEEGRLEEGLGCSESGEGKGKREREGRKERGRREGIVRNEARLRGPPLYTSHILLPGQ